MVETAGGRVEIHHERRRLAWFGFVCLAFVVGSVVLLTDDGWFLRTTAVVGIIFFGGGALVMLWRILRPAPAVVLDVVGISGTGWPQVRWGEIDRIWVSKVTVEGSTSYLLAISTVEPGIVPSRQPAVVRRASRLGRAISGGADMTLPLDGLDRSRDEVLALVEQYSFKTVDRAEADWNAAPERGREDAQRPLG